MTFTSDERREVAARLHEFADTDVWLSAMFAELEKFGDTDRPRADAIADLIDPTCHVVIPNEIEGDCFCSECGALIGEYGYTSYCPNCGRRLVGGNDC